MQNLELWPSKSFILLFPDKQQFGTQMYLKGVHTKNEYYKDTCNNNYIQ